MDNKREAIKRAYPHSQQWSEKVDKMSDAQVTAVHSRLMAEANKTRKRLQPYRRQDR